MKSFQNRLNFLEEQQRPNKELCVAFFWVRRGHEDEDIERRKMELKEYFDDLPQETYYEVFSYTPKEIQGATYEEYNKYFLDKQKAPSLKDWWKKQIIRGMPCREYKEDYARLKKI